MRYILIFIIILLISTTIIAEDDTYIIQQNSFVRIMPLYQGWKNSNNFTISEMSIPIYFYFPMNRNMSFSLQGNQANITGDVKRMNGFTDTQLNFSYHLETANLIFNIGVNYPSGKNELTIEELQTSSLLSLSYFNFQVPNFGQGLNVSPGLMWALALSDKFVLGLGTSYQYKGKFKPIKDMVDDYDPGDEILLTGGLDLRLSEKTTFVTDVIYTIYGSDKIKNKEVFISGNKILVSAKLKFWINYNQLLFLAHYRSKTKNSYVIGGILQEEFEKTIPDQIEIMGLYRIRLEPKFFATLIAEVRSFQSTSYSPELNILGVGVIPEIMLSSNINMPIRVKYLFGEYKNSLEISGLEMGIGLNYKF